MLYLAISKTIGKGQKNWLIMFWIFFFCAQGYFVFSCKKRDPKWMKSITTMARFIIFSENRVNLVMVNFECVSPTSSFRHNYINISMDVLSLYVYCTHMQTTVCMCILLIPIHLLSLLANWVICYAIFEILKQIHEKFQWHWYFGQLKIKVHTYKKKIILPFFWKNV